MRHRKSFNHLGRTSSHRKAMLANMATSLILHKRITTTVAKAKALRSYVEPLITRSKDDTTHSRRIVFSYLQSKEAVTELFREVAKKVADRPGGYTRIIKLGNRVGDNAELAMMELVDFNETLLAEKTKTKAKSTRRRRGGKKKSTNAGQKEAAVKETVTKEKTDEKAAEQTVEKETGKEKEAPAAETKNEETPQAEVEVKEPAKEEEKNEKKQEKKNEKKDEKNEEDNSKKK